MAILKFIRGILSSVSNISLNPIQDGKLSYSSDTNELFMDSGTVRSQINANKAKSALLAESLSKPLDKSLGGTGTTDGTASDPTKLPLTGGLLTGTVTSNSSDNLNIATIANTGFSVQTGSGANLTKSTQTAYSLTLTDNNGNSGVLTPSSLTLTSDINKTVLPAASGSPFSTGFTMIVKNDILFLSYYGNNTAAAITAGTVYTLCTLPSSITSQWTVGIPPAIPFAVSNMAEGPIPAHQSVQLDSLGHIAMLSNLSYTINSTLRLEAHIAVPLSMWRT